MYLKLFLFKQALKYKIVDNIIVICIIFIISQFIPRYYILLLILVLGIFNKEYLFIILIGILSSVFNSNNFLSFSPKNNINLIQIKDISQVQVGYLKLKINLKNKSYDCYIKKLPWLNSSKISKSEYRNAKIEYKKKYCFIKYLSKSQGVKNNYFLKFKNKFYSFLNQNIINSESSKIFLSMLFGDKSEISFKYKKIFNQLGLSYLLVVSGYQVGVLFYFINFLLIKINIKKAPQVSLFFIIIYVLLCQNSLSTIRALITICLSVWVLKDKKESFINLIFLSLFFVSVIEPLAISKLGIQLTFTALIAIYYSQKIDFNSKLLNYLYFHFLLSVSTSIICSFYFGKLYLLGLIINPILSPIFSLLVLNLGFLAIIILILSFGYLNILNFLIFLNAYLLYFLELVYLNISINLKVNYITSLLILISIVIVHIYLSNKFNKNDNSYRHDNSELY